MKGVVSPVLDGLVLVKAPVRDCLVTVALLSMFCLTSFPCCVIKFCDKVNMRERGLILTHNWKGQCIMAGNQDGRSLKPLATAHPQSRTQG